MGEEPDFTEAQLRRALSAVAIGGTYVPSPELRLALQAAGYVRFDFGFPGVVYVTPEGLRFLLAEPEP